MNVELMQQSRRRRQRSGRGSAWQAGRYRDRHRVKSGITGWAQVRYSYGASVDDAVEKLQHDLYYVKNNTLFLDIMIMIATVEVVLWGKGAR